MDGSHTPATLPLRPADEVMTLARLGVMQPTRLSFLRVLMRDLARMEAQVTRPIWSMDAKGHGHAVYSVTLAGHTYSLIAFSRHLADEDRSDRVIATAWDAAFVLFDGVPVPDDIARLAAEVPQQEAGRLGPKELVLSRANKSVRLFNHVVDALRAGRQPEPDQIAATGYLMRTTAVYGNGKFGLSDRAAYCDRPGLSGPFTAEMLTVWLIRGFTHDLAEHLGGAPLDRRIKRHLGIGNATGLGMAPFLVSHPLLIDAWFSVKETALARVLAQETISSDEAARLVELAKQAAAYLASWSVADADAMAGIEALRADWDAFCAGLDASSLAAPSALSLLFAGLECQSCALQELAAAWVIEAFGHLVDDLAHCQASPRRPELDAAMTCAELAQIISDHGAWAMKPDFDTEAQHAQFWYVSEEKLEPRLGRRFEEPGAELETPLDTARQLSALCGDLPDDDTPLWQFLAARPEHRAVARRAQALPSHPYAEVRANMLCEEAAPIHLLRAKLSFFGATRFDPKSRLWTRVTLAQGLPLADEIGTREAAWLPTF
ncbi:MAG: hypothetical protein AAGI10_07190 [Pseudomonadota bacterium]